MVMAGEFSSRIGMFDANSQQRLVQLIDAAGLPIRLREKLNAEDLLTAMGMDKKVVDGQLRLILARAIGSVEIVGDYPHSQLRSLLAEYAG